MFWLFNRLWVLSVSAIAPPSRLQDRAWNNSAVRPIMSQRPPASRTKGHAEVRSQVHQRHSNQCALNKHDQRGRQAVSSLQESPFGIRRGYRIPGFRCQSNCIGSADVPRGTVNQRFRLLSSIWKPRQDRPQCFTWNVPRQALEASVHTPSLGVPDSAY